MKYYVKQVIKGVCIFVIMLFTFIVIFQLGVFFKVITTENENFEKYGNEINIWIENIKN